MISFYVWILLAFDLPPEIAGLTGSHRIARSAMSISSGAIQSRSARYYFSLTSRNYYYHHAKYVALRDSIVGVARYSRVYNGIGKVASKYYSQYFSFVGTPAHEQYEKRIPREISVCRNFEANENGSYLGIFTCPLPFEPDSYAYCCGVSNAEFCCPFQGSTTNVIGAIVLSLFLICPIGFTLYAIQRWCRKEAHLQRYLRRRWREAIEKVLDIERKEQCKEELKKALPHADALSDITGSVVSLPSVSSAVISPRREAITRTNDVTDFGMTSENFAVSVAGSDNAEMSDCNSIIAKHDERSDITRSVISLASEGSGVISARREAITRTNDATDFGMTSGNFAVSVTKSAEDGERSDITRSVISLASVSSAGISTRQEAAVQTDDATTSEMTSESLFFSIVESSFGEISDSAKHDERSDITRSVISLASEGSGVISARREAITRTNDATDFGMTSGNFAVSVTKSAEDGERSDITRSVISLASVSSAGISTRQEAAVQTDDATTSEMTSESLFFSIVESSFGEISDSDDVDEAFAYTPRSDVASPQPIMWSTPSSQRHVESTGIFYTSGAVDCPRLSRVNIHVPHAWTIERQRDNSIGDSTTTTTTGGTWF